MYSYFQAFSYGIAYNGKLLWTFHYGHKNFTNTSSPKPNNDTPYPAASITKLFTVCTSSHPVSSNHLMQVFSKETKLKA